jgi:asparagine synthase (glutamine-hydrolysing)
MSIIFGLLKARNQRVAEIELEPLASATERYGTGLASLCLSGRVGMGLQSYFSHQRSEREVRPVVGEHGNVLSFDGRLDNYKELAGMLNLGNSEESDSQIVFAAFDRWGEECFCRLVGDWALVLWSEKDQTLYMARDHAGARTLYFQHECERVQWSTYLDSFRPWSADVRLDEDYVARYLSSHPIRDLTPYTGIRSVPPAHYITVRNGTLSQHAHWTSTVLSTIRYQSDAEYEAHFLALFRQSVERRTGAGAPILAQLSGGMDSTSIVCMSDCIRRSSNPDAEILDTISFYDDSEASLNERPYFSITEARRGKVGTHIDTAFSQRTFEAHDAKKGLYLLPGADTFALQQEARIHEAVGHTGYRSVLSGIGGDEVLGGVPIPFPELADHLVSGNIHRLIRQSIAWSLTDRSPLISTLYGTAKYAVDLYANPRPNGRRIAPWISEPFQKRIRQMEDENLNLSSRWGVAPHRLDNGLAWWSIMETLPHLFPQILSRHEYRYPFLDMDLVNYLFSIPRQQILRPGRRRSLMRRALRNIVPEEILERRRKAFQLRAHLSTIERSLPELERLFATSTMENLGFIDLDKLLRCLRSSAQGETEWLQALIKTIAFELWLKSNGYGQQKSSPERGDGRLHQSLIA